jgi:hypothetical protein
MRGSSPVPGFDGIEIDGRLIITIAAALWTATSASVPFVVGAAVKIAYDLTLWRLFRTVKPPEEAALR